MAIVFMILKVIGIVLLVLLGIVLMLLLAVLFVPIRYRVEGSVHDETLREKFDTKALQEKLSATASISWLFHLVNGRIAYPEDPEFTLRILCFRLFRTHLFDKIQAEDTIQEAAVNKKAAELETAKKETALKAVAADASKERKAARKESADHIKENHISSEEKEELDRCRQNLTDDQETLAADKAEYLQRARQRQKDSADSDQPVFADTEGRQQQEKDFAESAGEIGKLQKLKQKLYDNLNRAWKKAQEIGKNISYYVRILDSELFAAAMEKVSRQTKRILHQLLPRQWTLAGTVGTGDPGTDGKLLEIQGILYPWTAGHLYLQPEFEGCMVYLDFQAKGKITIFILLQAAASCYFDKKIKRVIRLLKKESSTKKSGKKTPHKKAA